MEILKNQELLSDDELDGISGGSTFFSEDDQFITIRIEKTDVPEKVMAVLEKMFSRQNHDRFMEAMAKIREAISQQQFGTYRLHLSSEGAELIRLF